MINQQVIIIRWCMVIILNLLYSMELILSYEYIIPPMIIDGLFNWLFPVLWVIYVYYCIGDHIFNLYPICTLWWVSFHYLPPFYCQHAQLTLHVFGKDSYHFTSVLPIIHEMVEITHLKKYCLMWSRYGEGFESK